MELSNVRCADGYIETMQVRPNLFKMSFLSYVAVVCWTWCGDPRRRWLAFIRLKEPIIKIRYRPKSDIRAGRRLSVVRPATGTIQTNLTVRGL